MTTTTTHAGGPRVTTASGAVIPAIGYGTGGMVHHTTVEAVLKALHSGYRHIDTARKYGSEENVGEALRQSGLPRDEIFVTTKVSHENLAPLDFERSTTESLKALGIDQVDLLMVHWPLPTMDLAATIGALAQTKRRGLARHIGVANFNLTLLEQAIRLSPEPLTALQAEFHPLLDQSRMIAACRRHGLAFIGYCPLARGRILDQPKLIEIAAAHGKSVAQVTLRWLIDHQGVCAIPSSINAERVAANFDIFDFALTPEERQRIDGLAKPDGRLVNPPGRAPDWGV
ncbi:MAG: 2,5-diketo-D-gluconate reductase [Xanthobacteraceae bacterium]|nr:2,5-diketo-D-gluconate reductase [Xanthobacteraceae bacterium]